jgi:REP element-mobilizing transposase RayT
MARPPRVFVPDGIYHIATRGSGWRLLFRFDHDRVRFLRRLAGVVEGYELECLSYCLIGNHYHLVVRTPDARLSRALQELHSGYSREFNLYYGERSHLFRNRFCSREVDSDAHVLAVCRYLALNPVRAGLCAEPSEWPWSSYRLNLGLQPAPPFLSEATLRQVCGGKPNWRLRYREFVEDLDLAGALPVDELLRS